MRNIILFIILILTTTMVTATITTQNVLYYSFDNETVSGNTVLDLSNQSNNGTFTGGSQTTGVRNESWDFPNSVKVTIPSDFMTSGPKMANMWVNYDTINDADINPIFWYQSTSTGYFQLREYNNELQCYVSTGAGWMLAEISPWDSKDSWEMITCGFNGSHAVIYRNATLIQSAAGTPGNGGSNTFGIGDDGQAVSYIDGQIDEIGFWDRALNQTEITTLFNSGDGLNPYASITEVANDTGTQRMERVTEIVENIPVAISGSSTTYQTIWSNLITPTFTGDTYITTTIELTASANKVAECKVLVNDTDYNTETQRSLTAGDTANIFLFSSNFSVINGTVYNIELQCRKTTAGNTVTIEQSDTLIHFMIDQNGNELNHIHVDESFTLSSSSFTLLYNATFNTTSNLTSGGFNRSLLVDGKVDYNYTSSGEMDVYAVVNGESTAAQPRTGSAGSIGTGGGFYIATNVTGNFSIPILIYGRSSTSDGRLDIQFNVKEVITEISEVGYNNYSTFTDLGKTVNFTTYQTIATINITNVDHPGSDLISKASLAINGSTDTTIYFRFELNGNTSQEYAREVSTGGTGISILQNAFEDIAVGQSLINLQARIDAGSGQIRGGQMITYLANTVTATPNIFNVTALRSWDNNSISSFTVSTDSGLSINTTSGGINFPQSDTIENITVSSFGYISARILNHNTSFNLTALLDNSRTIFRGAEIFGSQNATSFTVNGSFWTGSTTNGSLMLPITAGSNISLQYTNDEGYYNITQGFTVTAASNSTQNFNIYNHLINFTALNVLTGSLVDNFYVHLSTNGTTTTTIINTTNRLIPAINGFDYFALFNKSGYAFFNLSLSNLTGANSSAQFNVYTTNSLNITYYHAQTGELLNTTTITTQFIGTTSQTNTTTTGILFVDLFSPDTYTILSDATGFRQNKYEITIVNQSFQNLVIYMQPENNSNLVLLTVTDRFGTELENVQIIIQKWFNDAWVTEQIVSTDFNGQAEAYYILSDVFYNHVLKYQGQVVFGAINNDDNKKIIYTEDVTNGIRFTFDLLAQDTTTTYLTALNNLVNLSFSNSSNTTGTFRYFFSNNDGSQVTGEIKLFEALTGIELCSNTTSTSTGTLFCEVTSTSPKLYRAVGYIDGRAVVEYMINFGPSNVINFGTLGYFLGFIILIIAYFMFIEVPTLSIWTGSIALILLSLIKILFPGINFLVYPGLLALTYLVANIKSDSGVNA